MTAYWITGDTRDVLASMPDSSVDLILTSPPFLALRSYLPADHPDKAKEIGSEPTPADFLDTLLDLTVEWRRVLAPHGSLCVELGDTYAGSGGAGGDYAEGGMRNLQPRFAGSGSKHRMESAREGTNSRLAAGAGWPLDKSLCGIPELYRLSLAYGRNILRPDRLIEPWRIRNVIRWCRPNPPVGALGDKFRPGTSDMVVACTSRDRWFDLDAVRTEPLHPNVKHTLGSVDESRGDYGRPPDSPMQNNPAGAPPLDWWQISTEPYKGSHYATWPTALLTRPIQAMCPLRVCTTCGEPSRRIVGETSYERNGKPCPPDAANFTGLQGRRNSTGHSVAVTPTLGWTDCGHNTWRTGITLDPFAGSGTTLAVATGHGRDAIGIDLDERNLELARERVGMWLVEGSPFEERVA